MSFADESLEEAQENTILSVSDLNADVRELLEGTYDKIWVEGEISNFAAPGSGHWYFSLKDEKAQIRCALFRGNQRGIHFTPNNGTHVLIRARVSLYEARGDYQLIADHMEERGEGKLRRQFELLKKKLESEGLFADEHKQDFPEFPQQIGVITSVTGAAIRDILTVLKRRYPLVPVIVYPTLVQGETAAPAIVKAIQTANHRKECDVLLLARGGGSLEDLWPFNEESVARAIYKSTLPIMTGIGHEVDFTIADFVADYRAPTPSAAAELLTPDQQDIRLSLAEQQQQCIRLMKNTLSASQKTLTWSAKHLQQQHPKRRLTEQMQHLDMLEMKLAQKQTQQTARLLNVIQINHQRLQRCHPSQTIHILASQTQDNQHRLQACLTAQLNQQQKQLGELAAALNTLSPLATLKRGYAIATNNNGRILHDAKQVQRGDAIAVTLAKGMLNCEVK